MSPQGAQILSQDTQISLRVPRCCYGWRGIAPHVQMLLQHTQIPPRVPRCCPRWSDIAPGCSAVTPGCPTAPPRVWQPLAAIGSAAATPTLAKVTTCSCSFLSLCCRSWSRQPGQAWGALPSLLGTVDFCKKPCQAVENNPLSQAHGPMPYYRLEIKAWLCPCSIMHHLAGLQGWGPRRWGRGVFSCSHAFLPAVSKQWLWERWGCMKMRGFGVKSCTCLHRHVCRYSCTGGCMAAQMCVHAAVQLHMCTWLHTCLHALMCVCTHLHACIHVYMAAYTHARVPAYTHMHMCVHGCIHTCTEVCVPAHTHECVPVHTETYAYTCTQLCTHMYRCTHLHAHVQLCTGMRTHTHRRAQAHTHVWGSGTGE